MKFSILKQRYLNINLNKRIFENHNLVDIEQKEENSIK